MSKKVMIASVVSLTVILALVMVFGFGGSTNSVASEDKRAEETILKTANIPTNFNHERHQELFDCASCHHGRNSDGSMGPYIEGEEQTCVTCHNSKDMADTIVRGDHKLNTYEGIGHASCVGCHYKILKQGKVSGPTKRGNGKCIACHPSQKQYCPVRKWL
jgi:Class III cytochrome C family